MRIGEAQWRGREIVWCAVALLAGDYLGGVVQVPASTALLAASAAGFAAFFTRRWSASLAALFLLGFSGIQIDQESAQGPDGALRSEASRLQAAASAHIESLFDPERDAEEMSVAKALSVGDKSALSRSTKEHFRKSGATHLLALSGLHVGILYKMMGWMLSLFGAAPPVARTRGIVTLVVLLSYALVSGMSPSISRAVLMIAIFETGRLAGRRSDGLNSLATSAIILTAMNPSAPWDIGFQMSFSACLSIFTIFPRLESMLVTRSRLLGWIWSSATLAISCQMTTGMLAWYYFGTFPRYFIITNLLTVPLVGLIMYFLIATLLLAPLAPSSAFCAAVLCRLLKLLNGITATIASLG